MLRLGRVYGLTDPRYDDVVRYVGKTVVPLEDRLRGHINESIRVSITHKQRWIRSVLCDGSRPGIAMIECGIYSASELAQREIFWITRISELGASLTNLSAGGEGGQMHPDTIARMSAAAIERYKSKEARELTAAAQRGMVYSDESRLKMSQSARNYFSNPSSRLRHSEALIRAYAKPGAKEAWQERMRRRCVNCDLETAAPAMGRHTKATGHVAVKKVVT